MALAIFDLDDTLIDGDSATLWLHWLVREGYASPALLAEEARMMEAYRRGELHMEDYMAATLKPLANRSVYEVAQWVERFIEQDIVPRFYEEARRCLQQYHRDGWTILIISATGEHIVAPIARRFGVEHSLAIRLEVHADQYTGRTCDVLTFREGKVIRLHEWLKQNGQTLTGSHGYSDSINDVPMLSAVAHAFAVNPAPLLEQHAKQVDWPCLQWQTTTQVHS